MTDQEIRLKFGEMNAGEMRLARALVAWHEREIARLKAEREKWEADALRYCKNADFWRSEHDKAQDELAALQTENIRLKKELAHQLDMGCQAAVCAPRVALDEAVRRMEAVPVNEIARPYETAAQFHASECGLEAVRARLIAAAKGEGQAQPVVVNEPPYDEEPAWTPAVGDTVRLKSGGPVMTVTHVDPLSLMCAWMNANNELQVEPITTLCLEPAQP